MKRVKVKIIYTQSGDYTYSAYDMPVKEYNPKTDNQMLEESHSQLWSSDDFRKSSVLKYEVRETELPEWLPVKLFTDRYWYSVDKWESVFDAPDLRTAEWLLTLDINVRPQMIRLLNTKNFRSEFRKSLCNQIVEWLNTEPSQRKYKSPLSIRQWQALLGY